MPFTLAHAAAAIPLARVRSLSMPAVVIGTMVPDLPMFLRTGPSYQTTHAAAACVPVGVPLGLVLLLVFEWAKAPAIALLPPAARVRLADHASPCWFHTPGELFVRAVALALGIATHVVWDAFTHADGWAVALFGLSEPWARVGAIVLPGYKLLQHLSSLVGMALLADQAWSWMRARPAGADMRLAFSAWTRAALWGVLLAAVPTACAVRAALLSAGSEQFLHDLVYEFLTTTIAIDVLLIVGARALLRAQRSSAVPDLAGSTDRAPPSGPIA